MCPYSTVLKKRDMEEVALAGRRSQNALYALGIEYIPRLLSYMPQIKTNKPGLYVSRAHAHTHTNVTHTHAQTHAQTHSLTRTHKHTQPPTHPPPHTHTHLRGGGGSPGHHVLPVGHRTRQSVFFPHDFLLLSPPPPLPGVASSLPGDYLPPLSLCLTYLPL